MKVLDSRDKVLQYPRVVDILNTMFLAHFTDGRGNVRIPRGTHAREKVVFDLVVESASQASGNESSVGRRSLNLRLEPANWFSSVASSVGRITVDFLKVVRKSKQNSESQTRENSHSQDVSEDMKGELLVEERGNAVGEDVKGAKEDSVLRTLLNVWTVQLHSNTQGTTLSYIQDLRVEDRRSPVSSKYSDVVESLEVVHERSLRMIWGIIVEENHWLSTVTVRVLFMVVGVCVVLFYS